VCVCVGMCVWVGGPTTTPQYYMSRLNKRWVS